MMRIIDCLVFVISNWLVVFLHIGFGFILYRFLPNDISYTNYDLFMSILFIAFGFSFYENIEYVRSSGLITLWEKKN